MIVSQNAIFNLMDTNGRRKDVLNALKIYLEILDELAKTYPSERWEPYPNSSLQFLFYEKALKQSQDVFKGHNIYINFIKKLGNDYHSFITRDKKWVEDNFPHFRKVLDEAIEQRARHYTNTLVKMGLITHDRHITETGYSYLNASVARDDLEKLLPIDDINIILLRQLAKLKVFGALKDGKRQYYSPFAMALVLLLDDKNIDIHTFRVIVQGLTPYSGEEIKNAICSNSIGIAKLEEYVRNVSIVVPDELAEKEDVEYSVFKKFFTSSKTTDLIVGAYYNFFNALKDFRNNKNETTYAGLLNCLDGENAASLNKAFGYGKAIFAAGNKGSRYSLEKFIDKNSDHSLLIADDYVREFYTVFTKSKRLDRVKEYFNTTASLLSGTALFKLENLPELSYKEVLSLIFNVKQLRNCVFGEMTEAQYKQYEVEEKCYYCQNTSLADILNYSVADTAEITERIKELLGVATADDVKKLLNEQKKSEFVAHIDRKYPKEKIIKILPLFSDRKNDAQIKSEVNEAATIPTIYEYIIGIAWYYISHKEFDLYDSLNLTLNADFEPVIHAGGGVGDIVINYEDIVIMLEVTLMNKQAQKRGEWEPVLRHSLNLKAANAPRETITFFVADELDYNTINIWRAVAAVSLKSTDTNIMVDGVVIMPFTNKEILRFLSRDIYYKKIVDIVKDSFQQVSKSVDISWHEDIVQRLLQ